jgi:hypothetical protein
MSAPGSQRDEILLATNRKDVLSRSAVATEPPVLRKTSSFIGFVRRSSIKEKRPEIKWTRRGGFFV